MLEIIPYICNNNLKNKIMLTEKTAKLIVRKKTNITHFESKDGEKKTKILVYVGDEGPGDSWEDCTCFLEVVNDELVIYPNDRHMQDYLEDFNFTKLIDNLINDKNNGQEIHEHPNCKQFLPVRKEESTNEVEEEVKEIIIGEFKPKRKFLNFISSVNGAKVRFIRDIAFIEGKKLSGMLEGAIFKITICDEGTINFEEQVEDGKEPVSNTEMIKRLISDIDDIDVTGYAQKFVVNGLPFKDINGDLCYLEVEHKKPIDLLASIFNDKDEEEENMNISEKGLSVLDQLFGEEEKVDKVTSILDELFPDDETETNELETIEEVKEEVKEEPKSESLSYMEESFRKMNESKVKELESRIEEKTNEINKFNIDIKQAETKLQETEEQLGVLQTRLETMTPGDDPNGYFFLVSDEQKLETGLDETTKNIADKIADIMKLKKDVLFKYLTGGYYNISIGKKDDITSEIDEKELTKLVSEKVLVIDPSGKFTFDEVNGRTVVQYRGDLNWHQLTSKLIRKGFEQDEEFDKLAGSNSYESKTEEENDGDEPVNDIDLNMLK